MITWRTATASLVLSLATGIAFAEIKVGVFDFQRVSEETARGQQLRADLEKFKGKKQGEITAKQAELKSLIDQYTAQALSLSPDKRAASEKEIEKKKLDLQNLQEGAQREMQLELTEAQGKFNAQLMAVLEALGKDRGYTLIFAREQVAFVSGAADITSELIERFNQETAKGATAAAAPTPDKAGSGGTTPKP